MEEIEKLMRWAIDSLTQTPEERGDWQAKINEIRTIRMRSLKVVNNQIKACRLIGLECPELEKNAKNHIEVLKQMDEIEARFKASMN